MADITKKEHTPNILPLETDSDFGPRTTVEVRQWSPWMRAITGTKCGYGGRGDST